MEQVVLYSANNCQECERARMLLESIGINYLEYKLDKDFTNKQFISEFGKSACLPQFSFGYKHIGGLKEALQYLKQKQLIN